MKIKTTGNRAIKAKELLEKLGKNETKKVARILLSEQSAHSYFKHTCCGTGSEQK